MNTHTIPNFTLTDFLDGVLFRSRGGTPNYPMGRPQSICVWGAPRPKGRSFRKTSSLACDGLTTEYEGKPVVSVYCDFKEAML